MEIEGLSKKSFEFTIKWVVDADYALENGTGDYIERLQEVGSTEITNINLIDKEGE